jgi:hypothetical protein
MQAIPTTLWVLFVSVAAVWYYHWTSAEAGAHRLCAPSTPLWNDALEWGTTENTENTLAYDHGTLAGPISAYGAPPRSFRFLPHLPTWLVILLLQTRHGANRAIP